MLENAKRMEKGVPSLPKVKLEGIRPYFDRLRQTISKSDTPFPRWVGELYLEYHRGTLTSLAKNKRNNAAGEHLLRELELLSVMSTLNGHDETEALAEIDALWKILLLNQFHDILPGTSIPQVYIDSDADYAALFEHGAALRDKLTDRVFKGQSQLVNAQGVTRRNALVQFDADQAAAAVDFGFGARALQAIERADGTQLQVAPIEKIAPFAAHAARAATKAVDEIAELSIDRHHLENAFLRVDIADNGDIVGIFEKRTKRQILRDGTIGNQLKVYQDKPLNWDAWDIDWFYEEKSWTIDAAAKIEVIETGPHRAALRIERQYKQSSIVQIISLQVDARQVEFDFYADWQESQSLLKAEFDFELVTDQLKSQIQFGHVTRPTHRNTSWDRARFEASMHRWVAFEETDFAVGVLNDCKYGYSATDTHFGLTLIKSGIYPHPTADQEEHLCRYAVMVSDDPHPIEVINQQALDFATPLCMRALAPADTIITDNVGNLLECPPPNVILHATKISENGQDVIFRLCEETGKRTRVRLKFDPRLGAVRRTNLLEQDEKICRRNEDGSVEIDLNPFEILTLAAALD